MTETKSKSRESQGLEVRHGTSPLVGVIVFLVCVTILVTFSVGGDLLENGTKLSQEDMAEDMAPFCPIPATIRLSLRDLSQEGEAGQR